MPRYARKRNEKGIHHVVVQGRRLEEIFRHKSDKDLYLEILFKYKAKTGIKLYAFCILENHVHLVIEETAEESISVFMRRIGVSFSYWYRLKYDLPRGEALFRGRYLSEPLQTEEEVLEVVRHIHQEPVRAGLTDRMEKYAWSSYRLYLIPGNLVDRRLVLDSLHFSGGYTTYMNQAEGEVHMLEEVPLKYGRSDDEAATLVQIRLQEIGCVSLNELEGEEKDNFLRNLKLVDEISIQQLSRVTGINRGYIHRL